MWFKNLRIFRLSPSWSTDTDVLEAALEKHAFHPASRQDMQSVGWTAPRENGPLVHAFDGQYLFALRTEKKLLPATVINQFTRVRAQEIEEQQGYKPGRKQMREIKEQVTDELLPKAFSIFRDTRIWMDLRNRWLVIDAAATATSDEIIGLLAKTLDPFPVTPLYVNSAPATAMTEWLLSDMPLLALTVDQDAELRSTSENRAVVRYVRHSLDIDDVKKHVGDGKQCTRLALTWADRISFVLTENLEVRRVTPLDVLTEQTPGSAGPGDEDEQFESDFALMTGELAHMLDDLVAALGGEKQD